MLDASVFIRFYKCQAVQSLQALEIHVGDQVKREVSRRPGERAAFDDLNARVHPVRPGTTEWDHLAVLRGGFSTRGLGEDESIAICLAEQSRGNMLPLCIFDNRPQTRAQGEGIVTLGFLDVLVWLVERGSLTYDSADKVELQASMVNGWKRPPGYSGRIADVADSFGKKRDQAMKDWQARLAATKARNRRSRG